MLIAMLNSTFILVAIFKYDCHTRDVSFEKFWRARCVIANITKMHSINVLGYDRCEADWQLSYKAFSIGM
jgi:hypothetical protein